MAEKSVNEISRDVRQIFQKGNDALTRENYDYAIDLLMQVLDKEPGFYEGRKALRLAQQRKAGGGGGNSAVKARAIYTKASEVERAFNARYGAGASMGTEHDFAGHLQKIMKEAELAGTPLVMD